jgi:hypothetical protein
MAHGILIDVDSLLFGRPSRNAPGEPYKLEFDPLPF